MTEPDPLDLAALRARLKGMRGPRLWRSLDEAADTPAFKRFVAAEFPAASDLLGREASRRGVLRAMAASFLLGGLGACDVYPPEEIIPWVEQPEALVPGQPLYYATMVPFMGWAIPVVAETHVGRPTRLDGNARHPAWTTALDPISQARVLELYDPDRSSGVVLDGAAATWAAARTELADLGARPGLALVTGHVTSPTMLRQIAELRERAPALRWFVHEPALGRTAEAARRVFGQPVEVRWDLSQADVIVALDADPLGPGPFQVPYTQSWAARRQLAHQPGGTANALFVAESSPSLTGARATQRRRVPSHRVPALVAAIANAAGLEVEVPDLSQEDWAWAGEMARRLELSGGNSLILVGDHQPPEAQALALALNVLFANIGSTVLPLEPQGGTPDGDGVALLDALEAAEVDSMVMVGTNPAYTLPGFTEAAKSPARRVHVGLYRDETAVISDLHVPMAHALESWSDGRAVDGTAVIGQPTVQPLFGGIPLHDVMAALLGRTPASPQGEVRQTWAEALTEAAWRSALHEGFVPATAAARTAALASVPEISLPDLPPDDSLEIVFRPDPAVWDGSVANLGWLQELPRPMTKLTWDTAALVSPVVAEDLGLEPGSMVEITAPTGTMEIPAWIVPGQAERTITLFLGQGHWHMGAVANGVGENTYRLRSARQPWVLTGATIRATGVNAWLADTQMHQVMEGHEFVRTMPLEDAHQPPKEEIGGSPHETLYPGDFQWEVAEKEPQAWAMAIDLDLCTGCNACVTACQAENNIMVVGREETRMGREMHWIRVDQYFEGDLDDPAIHFQPVPCMHCEHAPCEMGCPVNATVHGPEGLNQMIYNRCIGTRTCSSYCPYKVRRFNFYDYSEFRGGSKQALMNPDVTVRSRGVMEKCTYCVQRISRARRTAKTEDRPAAADEVETACQTACPANAIVFGNQRNPDSAIAAAKRSPRDYALLEELNVRPRTTYAARIRDADPDGGEG